MILSTPAFVICENSLVRILEDTQRLAYEAGCSLLYSPKACSSSLLLEKIVEYVEGFSCSTLAEATLIHSMKSSSQSIHLTSPGIPPQDMEPLSRVCDRISFNSISQLEQFSSLFSSDVDKGLRINPETPWVKDDRYNPCRQNSKLGVPLQQFKTMVDHGDERLRALNGVHFHNNCDSVNAGELMSTVRKICESIPEFLHRAEWINLGGGYLLTDLINPGVFLEAICLLKEDFDLEVIIEPGAALARDSITLVCRVLDIFDNGDMKIAVLDTTINHLPEVFEYQYFPDIQGHQDNGKYKYVLAGRTCLAGDEFGAACFNQPLEIGAFVTFTNAGAYTMSRANTFNKIPLPGVYLKTVQGNYIQEQNEDFSDTKRVTTYANS